MRQVGIGKTVSPRRRGLPRADRASDRHRVRKPVPTNRTPFHGRGTRRRFGGWLRPKAPGCRTIRGLPVWVNTHPGSTTFAVRRPPVIVQGTSVGLDVHAHSAVAHAIDEEIGKIARARLCPDHGEVVGAPSRSWVGIFATVRAWGWWVQLCRKRHRSVPAGEFPCRPMAIRPARWPARWPAG